MVLAVSTSVYAACANREKDEASDLFDDIKCGLSTAGDKLKDGASSIGSSLKDGTTKAIDAISKAAVKTGTVLRDGLNVAVEKSKSGYGIVKDAITGRHAAENRDIEGIIDVRSWNASEVVHKVDEKLSFDEKIVDIEVVKKDVEEIKQEAPKLAEVKPSEVTTQTIPEIVELDVKPIAKIR